MSVVPMEIITI